jgi:hypothetical protein
MAHVEWPVEQNFPPFLSEFVHNTATCRQTQCEVTSKKTRDTTTAVAM